MSYKFEYIHFPRLLHLPQFQPSNSFPTNFKIISFLFLIFFPLESNLCFEAQFVIGVLWYVVSLPKVTSFNKTKQKQTQQKRRFFYNNYQMLKAPQLDS